MLKKVDRGTKDILRLQLKVRDQNSAQSSGEAMRRSPRDPPELSLAVEEKANSSSSEAFRRFASSSGKHLEGEAI